MKLAGGSRLESIQSLLHSIRHSRALAKIRDFASVPADKPELVKAQCAALSRLMPPMYLILLANTWVLAANFEHVAPVWLTVYCPLLLTVVSVVRLSFWWRRRNVPVTTETAVRALTRANWVAGILSAVFSFWALQLLPYGDALMRSHIAFYLAVGIIGCVICLVYLRLGALLVMGVVSSAFIAFFATTGDATFIAMAVCISLVTAILLGVVLLQDRDFARMIDAQTEAMALITENKRKEQEQSRLLRMLDDMPVAVMTVDPQTFKINYVNETSKRTLSRIEGLLPITANELVGTSIDVFHKHPEHQRRLLADPANLPHRARIKLGPEMLDLQVTAVSAADGSYIAPMLTWSIITQQVAAENRIRHLAHYDTLTGLANRTTFRERLEEHLEDAHEDVALLFIDLDGFKIINDSKGHLVGDAILKQITDRLHSVCRQPAVTTIGRLGGDEFAILMAGADPKRAATLASEIIEALADPIQLDVDRRVSIGASIGIALAPVHGEDAELLLSRADIALYAAKAAGKGTFRIFCSQLEERIQERVRLEAKLRIALEQELGLYVFYQPIVDVATSRITAREALVRWYHPQRGWISPTEFIPVAEETGLIEQLGQFVLNRACRDAATWDDGARVAVNISPGQLGKGGLVPCVLTALLASGLPPNRLELEVTESALLNNELDCVADLRRLHEMGIRVALDDFGTGYSSLAHVRAFPFDKIKIDGSFVRDAVERPDCAAVVKVVADLGKRLGVTTVAEGVETQAQLQLVTQEGCSEVQGYIFGKPAPSAKDEAAVDELNRQLIEASAA